MGFYGLEPFSHATATYLALEPEGYGAFNLEVEGDAPNYTSGIQLIRDSHWVAGLKVDVMGWTGPLAEGKMPYKVSGTFPGEFRPQIILSGANGERVVEVKVIPRDEVEDYLKHQVDENISGTNDLGHAAKLAYVNSAKIIESSILINPSVVEITAQKDGFNWILIIGVEDVDDMQVIPEYLPYRVIEVQDGPGWPPKLGIGPVVPPTTLHKSVYRTGSKGIAVVGSNQTINLDVQPPEGR